MLIVSNYHYIRTDFNSPYPSIFGVTPVQFKNQLMQLGKMGAFVHPKELVSNPEFYINSKEPFVLITFDDGLKEQFELAKPILEGLGISALFFVNSINHIERTVPLVHQIHLVRSIVSPKVLLQTFQENYGVLNEEERVTAQTHYNYDLLESAEIKYALNFKLNQQEQQSFVNSFFHNYFDEDEVCESLYMEKEHLQILANEGELGSHTHSHLPLGKLDEELINKEIETTKVFLESITNTEVNTISYPYGNEESCTDSVINISKQQGFLMGFTVKRGVNETTENLLRIKRFDCNDLPGGKNYK
jgi:peptidoglycan/xylan/chitin deacetylase (PgdA/CDA1 family)